MTAVLELRDVDCRVRRLPGPVRRVAHGRRRRGGRPGRLERRRQDHDRPGRVGAGRPVVRSRSSSTARTSPDRRRTRSPAPASPTPPRAGRCSRTLTVEENLVAVVPAGSAAARACVRGLDEAYELFPALADAAHQTAGTLSGGEQRMLSMARVLVEAPKLLIADELSLGLAPIIVDRIYEALAAAARRGHRAAHRRAARVARPRPVRPGRRAGPRHRRLVRPGCRRHRTGPGVPLRRRRRCPPRRRHRTADLIGDPTGRSA